MADTTEAAEVQDKRTFEPTRVLAREENRRFPNREKTFLTDVRGSEQNVEQVEKSTRPYHLKVVKIDGASLLGIIRLPLTGLSRRSTPVALALLSKFLMYQAGVLCMAMEM